VSLLGIVSDTHDNLEKVRAVVDLFNRRRPDLVLHCGDFVAQFVLREFGRLDMKLTGVFGNNDGDRQSLRDRASEFGFELHDGPYAFEFGGRRFVASHEPVAAPRCDYYVHGHTHRACHMRGDPTIINPGEACGWLTGTSTVALLDVDADTVEFCELQEGT
jgi:putative phosphoesterase